MLVAARRVDTAADNVANLHTPGFKRADLVSLDLPPVDLPVRVGTGARVVLVRHDWTQGALLETGRETDLAIEGNGFFVLELPGGTRGYTRAGALWKDAEGTLRGPGGHPVLGVQGAPIRVPRDAIRLAFAPDGRVSAMTPNGQWQEAGRLAMARFPNPDGLEQVGHGIWVATGASGEPFYGVPGEGGMGTVLQGYLEASNADVVREAVELLRAQRVYEMGAQIIRIADGMWQRTNNIAGS